MFNFFFYFIRVFFVTNELNNLKDNDLDALFKISDENLYPIKLLVEPHCTLGQQYLEKQLLKTNKKVDNNNYDYLMTGQIKASEEITELKLAVGHAAFIRR